MAQIIVNEVSQNYSFNIGTNSYACVAMPITASWGPGYEDPTTAGVTKDAMLESVNWKRFPATQSGLEAFVATYRGPASNYRIAKDYSYQMAMTLMTAGYDVLVCRLCPGTPAQKVFNLFEDAGSDSSSAAEPNAKPNAFVISAKYPGTFGNNLRVAIKQMKRFKVVDGVKKEYYIWNVITYVVDSSNIQTAVENLVFVTDIENSTDSILHIDEIDSDFISIKIDGHVDDSKPIKETTIIDMLEGGTDKAAEGTAEEMMQSALQLATQRYAECYTSVDKMDYIKELSSLKTSIGEDVATASTIRYKEWLFTSLYSVLDLLDDKLTYNHNRLMLSGWDDQDIKSLNPDTAAKITAISPLHLKLLELGYKSRCSTSYIDIPRSVSRSEVYNESEETPGYAQILSRYEVPNTSYDVNTSLYSTHSALFAPWGQYTYVGTSKYAIAPPSFLALMIERAMILNQSVQYEWLLPTNRLHSLNIGPLDYTVSKKLLDKWQSLDGVGVNVITNIPDIGMSLWGNSTLYEVPVATYQALANLSTRKMVNAIEDLVYRCGIQITFQYNNEQAYSSFYAGVTPLLDVMKNQGAIEDYYVRMSADINGLERVNANSVIGKIYLVVNGVINDITVDLVALPPTVSLDQFRG